MGWPEVLTIVGANFVLMISFLASMYVFFTHLDTKNTTMINHLDTKTNNILTAIQQEMKDFHGRLCAIEERKKLKE